MNYDNQNREAHVILSEETIGELSEQAHRQRGSQHVILSEAKDLRPACLDGLS